jgi:serine/threonine protein kinase
MEVKTLISAPVKHKNEDYSTVLRVRNLKYKEADQYYWQVGNIKATQGWIIHVSVVKTQIKQLLTAVLPELIRARLPFKIIRDHHTANLLLNANFGYERVGKILSVYPENEEAANAIADKLIALTAPFKGPAIPTDARLAGNVYARYGSFNPILINNEFGLPERHLKDSQGNLVKDVYTMPFALPKGVSWPFKNAKQPAPKTLQVFNNTYLVIKELKNDAKGRVFKTYQVKDWWIKTTVLKEARHNAGTDDQDRDVAERLKWQYSLHQKLSHAIPLPKVYGYFEEDGNSYFAMEFISGKPISEVIHTLIDRAPWANVPLENRHKILGYLLELLDIIDRLHMLGYVHRDISPANFIVNKKDKITLIDLEGAYSLQEQQPSPPYYLGTPGFTSPEQNERPYSTVKEDIFSIGALTFALFTGVSPAKFLTDHQDRIAETLPIYGLDDPINQLIGKCLDQHPEHRPELSEIISEVAHYKNAMTASAHSAKPLVPHATNIEDAVIKGINAFESDIMAEPGQPWHFAPLEDTPTITNRQSTKAIYAGLANGIGGALYIMSKARQADIKINYVLGTCSRNIKFLDEITNGKIDALSPGLFDGSAGIAVALNSLQHKLLSGTKPIKQKLLNCLDRDTDDITLAHGAAGQLVATLLCSNQLSEENIERVVRKKIDAILKAQRSRGDWSVKEKPKFNALSEGISGIVLALLAGYCYLPEETLCNKVKRALRVLDRHIVKILTPHGKSRKKDIGISTSFTNGLAGTAFCYLQAWRVFHEQSSKDNAERLLRYAAQHIMQDNLSLANGMIGLGHLFLEAREVLATSEFDNTLNTITNVLLATQYETKNTAHWNVKDNKIQSVSLMEGSGGAVHYFMRLYNSEKIPMPIFESKLFENRLSSTQNPAS